MLPKAFLRVAVKGGLVKPVYARPDGPASAAAEAVLEAYRGSVGRKRAEIRSRILDLEEAFGDYKLVRGLAELVERKCLFEGRPAVNPVAARHMLFLEAARRGIPVTSEERGRIIAEAAAALDVPPSLLEDSLYADLECEERLAQPPPDISGEQLVREYNLSLTQTLLFNSAEVAFTASGNWKRIFRAIKFYGLLYEAWRDGGGFTVKVDGPLSIFKMTRRYGTSLAKILPEVIRGAPWSLSAKIMRERGGEVLRFTLNSEVHGWLLPESPPVQEEYDSEVERQFAEAFRAAAPDWAVRREAEPLPAGYSVIIPDFILEKSGRKAAVEIVGFWTPEYLKRKLEKLASVRGMPIIVAVDEKLACSEVERVESLNPSIHILYYKGKIRVGEVLKTLKKITGEEAVLKAEPPLIADKGGVKAPIREAARGINIGGAVVPIEVIEAASKALIEKVGERAPLQKAIEVLEKFNLPLNALSHCGYTILWKTILPKDAEVILKKNTIQP